MRKEKGVISIFLALIFSTLFMFLLTMIDVTRINSAKNQYIVASDAAMTSAMTQYDSELYENYGLLAFENNDEITNIVKEIFSENISNNENNLFNLNVDEENLVVTATGNPFTDNEIMKKQMIYAMKYQGTENLARNVFEKIKSMLNSKDIIEDSENMNEAEELAEELNEKIGEMNQGKLDAMRTIVNLAKNNCYETLTKNSDKKIIDYKHTIDLNALGNIYSDNSVVTEALNSVDSNSYTEETVLPKVYSYAYTKMVSLAYVKYLESEKSKQQAAEEDNTNNGSNGEINIEKPENSIDYDTLINNVKNTFLKSLKNSYDYNKELKNYKSYLENQKKAIDEGKAAAEALYTEKKNIDAYNSIREKYSNIKDQELKKEAEETLKYYEDTIYGNLNENKPGAEDVKNALEILSSKVESTINAVNFMISDSENSIDSVINQGQEKGANSQYESYFKELHDFMSKYFNNGTPEIDIFITDLTNNKSLLGNNSPFKPLIEGIQIEIINDIKINQNATSIGVPEEDSIFEKFYKKLKERLKNNDDKKGLKETLKSYDSTGVISGINLPSDLSESSQNNEKLSDMLSKVSIVSSDASLGEIILTGAGTVIDPLYFTEYIMSNFTDILVDSEVNDLKAKRIPEQVLNTQTPLNYEIEAIISGKYDDQKSKDTLIDDLFAIRMTLNTVSYHKNQKDIKKVVGDIANKLELLTQYKIPAPLTKFILSTAIITAETRYDVIDIFNGYDIPLLKNNKQWLFDLGIGSGFDIDVNMDDIDKNADKELIPQNGKYNKDNGNVSLNYSDLLRLKLITKYIVNNDKLIDNCQDIIVANMNSISSEGFDFTKYNTELNIDINNPEVNILFNTSAFNGDKHKFRSFTFKKTYN